MEFVIDRISPITTLLDEVFYQSSIEDMRRSYFRHLADVKTWLVLSDYYLGKDKTNKVLTFTALPYMSDLPQLQNTIRSLAPRDFKHSRTINARFIKLLHQLPVINISFIFQQDKYFAWNNSEEFQEYMADFCDILSCYIAFWRQETNQVRLDKLEKNIEYIRELLQSRKKTRLLCEAFVISLLGGYVGSILCRETALTDLCWLSDRDRTNELGRNLVRDLFQIYLIDIIKKNISFSFTAANSNSEEWYEDLTRIPDIITGAIAGFDFRNSGNNTVKPAALGVIGAYLCNNRTSCFTYQFVVNDDGVKVQRVMITGVQPSPTQPNPADQANS